MNELAWQRKIIQRAGVRGGYGRKWASQYSVGVPDLILVHGGNVCFVEVKLEKVTAARYFRHTLKVTAKQEYELQRLRAAGAMAFIVAVLYYGRAKAYLLPVFPDGDYVVSSDDIERSYDWYGSHSIGLMDWLIQFYKRGE